MSESHNLQPLYEKTQTFETKFNRIVFIVMNNFTIFGDSYMCSVWLLEAVYMYVANSVIKDRGIVVYAVCLIVLHHLNVQCQWNYRSYAKTHLTTLNKGITEVQC